MLRTTARLLYEELRGRDIEVEIFSEARSMLRYKKDGTWHYLRGSAVEASSSVGVSIANDKRLTHKTARLLEIPQPASCLYQSNEQAVNFLEKHKILVVKPTDAAHGDGVTVNVDDAQKLQQAIIRAKQYSSQVLLQQMVTKAEDVRLLVLGDTVVDAVIRKPATIVGDGQHTIRELIAYENTHNPLRGHRDTRPLNYISQEAAELYLSEKIHTIPGKGESLQVVGTANLGTGGVSVKAPRYSDPQHPCVDRALRITKELKLAVAGVDFLLTPAGDAYFIEINACPGLGLHYREKDGVNSIDKIFINYIMNI